MRGFVETKGRLDRLVHDRERGFATEPLTHPFEMTATPDDATAAAGSGMAEWPDGAVRDSEHDLAGQQPNPRRP